MVTRELPEPDRLRAFAEHVLYDASMLYETTYKLMNRHHKDDPAVENALLESFGIHCRSLIDFFWHEPGWDTDAVASDWIEGWTPPEMSERLKAVNDRVGKEIVHLSYKRLDLPDDEKGWIVLGLGPEVIGAFLKFAAEVPDDLVPEGWRDRAYSATGAIPPEQAKELEPYMISVSDLRLPDLPSMPTQMLKPSTEE